MNIYEKMLGITSELTKVAKNLEVGYGQNKYKAVGEADVLAAVRPLEEKYKVYSYPVRRNIVETGELETKAGLKNLFLRIETVYRFINIEKVDEFIEITSYGDGVDSQDKSVGKAMTYSDKYALMKAYKIMTGDDPDQNLSEDLKGKNTKPTYSKKETQDKNTTPDKKVALATKEQLEILERQDEAVQKFALKKFSVDSLDKLTGDQANYIVSTMEQKGTLK